MIHDELVFKIDLPVPYHSSKKNDKRTSFRRTASGKLVTYNRQGKRSSQARDFILNRLVLWKKQNPNFKTIDFQVNAQMLFYFPFEDFFLKDEDRQQKTLIDLSNAYQMIEDCLQNAKILSNDGLIKSHDGSDRRPMPKGYSQPFVRIVLRFREPIKKDDVKLFFIDEKEYKNFR